MDRNISINLKINADTSGLRRSLAGIGDGVQRIKVPVDLEPSTKDLGINIRTRLDGAGEDFGRAAATQIRGATVRADFGGFVADQLATRIAKATGSAVEDAVRKGSKGDLFGAVGGLIGKAVSIPVQAVAGTVKAALGGIIDGATATARTAFQGVVFGATQSASAELGAGINAGLQKALGGTIGSPELIGRKLIEKLAQGISQAAAKTAEAAGFDSQALGRDLNKAVQDTLGEREVLTDSRAKSADERQVQTRRQESAQVELNRERQSAFRIQAAAVESYAAITQSVERQSKELVQKNAETIRKLQTKLSELAAEAKQQKTEPVNKELVKKFQQEIRASKLSLKSLQDARSGAGAEVEAALASATTDEDRDAIAQKAKAYQVALRKELAGKFKTLLDSLLAPAAELEQIQQQAKAKLDEAFAGSREARANFAVVEGGEAYRANLEQQARVLDKQQIELAERIQERQQVLKKGIETEAAIASELKSAPPEQSDKLKKLQTEAQRTIKAVAKEINDLRDVRKGLTDEIASLAERAQAVPQGPNKVVSQILKEFGAEGLSFERIPQLQRATGASLKSTTTAQYLPELNVIQVRADLFEALQKATSALDLTTEQQRVIREEVFHSLQFGAGSLEGLSALENRAPLVTPGAASPQEIAQAGRGLNYYAPDTQQIELQAKIAANRATDAAEAKAARETAQQELFKKAGYAGVQGSEILGEVLTEATKAVTLLREKATVAGREINLEPLSNKLAQKQADLGQFSNEAVLVASGEGDSTKIAEISQGFDRIKADILKLRGFITELSTDLDRAASAPVAEASGQVAGALATVEQTSHEVSSNLERLGGKLAPAVKTIGGGVELAGRGLVAVGKAGLALADKIGFAAASFVPGGALAYGPAKEAVKFAAPAVAVGALATQVPEVGAVINAITSTVGAILAPATSGLSVSVGHAVSAEIAGALPSLFNALTHAVAESGLPGAQITAQAVDKLGGGLVHLLEPVINGVASAADASIVGIGQAVNDFLGEVGGLLLAGKGVQEGVKLATNEDARKAALQGIETVGSGIGQIVYGVQDGIQDAQDAIDRTKRAVQQNLEGVKGAAEKVSKGDIRAVGEAIDQTQAAVGNLSRGVQDVAKAASEGIGNVVGGVGKAVSVFGDLTTVKLPDGIKLAELAKEQLIKVQAQLRQKLERTIQAESQGLPVIGGSASVKKDLDLVAQVLEAKYEVVIDEVGDQVQKQIQSAPLELPVRVDPLPELEPVIVKPTVEQVTQKQRQEVEPTLRSAEPRPEEEPSPIELAQEQLRQPPKPAAPLSLDELTRELDLAIRETDDEIKKIYAAFTDQITAAKSAIKKGDDAAIAKATAESKRLGAMISSRIAELQGEISGAIGLLAENGIPVGPDTPIGERLRKTKAALGQKAALVPQQLNKIDYLEQQRRPVPDDLEFESLQSIDLSLAKLETVFNEGSASLSKALKKLVDTVFEVQGETLSQSLSLAARSPRGTDLAVNAAGLAASAAASTQGPVAGLAADLIGALAARQAMGGGGTETFGDITGFIAGNAANKLTGIPGSGAIAASVVVPQLQKLRDQIQAKYGQPIEVEVPVDLQFEGLQAIDQEVAQAQQQVNQIDALLAELRQLEAEGKLVTPTVGERISGFLGSISKAFTKNDADDIGLAIARIETELARAADGVTQQLSEETQQIVNEADRLAAGFDQATGRIEKSLYEFERVKGKINDLVLDAGGKVDAQGGDPLQVPPQPQTFDQFVEQQNEPINARRAELQSQQQQQIAEIDQLIAQEQERLAEVRRLAVTEQRLKIGEIDLEIDQNLAQLKEAKARAEGLTRRATQTPDKILANAADQQPPTPDILRPVAEAAQQGLSDSPLSRIAQFAAQRQAEINEPLKAIALAAEEGRKERDQFNERLRSIAEKASTVPSNTVFSPIIQPQRATTEEEQLRQQLTEAQLKRVRDNKAKQEATKAIQALEGEQALQGIEAIALTAKEQQDAIATVDQQLERAAKQSRDKARQLTQRIANTSGTSITVPSNIPQASQPLPKPENPITDRLAAAAAEGSQKRDELSNRLAAVAEEGQRAAEQQQQSFSVLIQANTDIIRTAEQAAKQTDALLSDAARALVAIEDVQITEEQVQAELKRLYERRGPVYDAELPRIESDRLSQLQAQREQAQRPIENYQAEDLSQFVVPKQIIQVTDEDRGLAARKRLERDASERQINDYLRQGKAPTDNLDEIQIQADLAISSFEKSSARFDAIAKQIDEGSTRTQRALRGVGQGVETLKQKIADNGGITGVLGKIGQSMTNLAEKAGVPVGAIGKLGNIIKGVGIAALAYIGITQLGDALVTLGRQAFETYSKFELLQARLKFVGGGDSALATDLKFIREESDRLKIPVDQLAESFTALRIATKDTALEGRTQQLATSLGTLGRVYGLTAEASQSVQYQLGQTIRLGRAQGDELRSISDAGINVSAALGKTLGKSGAQIADLLERGQISAEQVTDALVGLAAQSESGLPAALETSAVQVDKLKKEFADIALTVGERTAPLVVAGVNAIGQGVQIVAATAEKLSPIFAAVAQGAGLIGDIASPIVGIIGAIVGAVGGDLLDGIAIPFQFIGDGLAAIRQGLEAVSGVAGTVINSIGAQVQGLVSGIPILGQIAEYANPATIAIRLLGAAIGTYLVAQMVQLSVTIGSFVVTSLIAMAGTITATVIPAIGAATTAALAFLATPLGLTIAAIGVAAAVAAPHLDDLALAYFGLSQAQVDANNRSIAFNSEYEKGLNSLQKGIPLTAEQLQSLKDGLAQSAKEGKTSAHVTEVLSSNLDRLQASAEAAAKIQGQLTKAMADSAKAIKETSTAIDAANNTQLAGLNEALANQQITRERFDQQELEAQGQKSAAYLELYATQGANLSAALAQAQAALIRPLPDATRTEVLKQVDQLKDQINQIDTKSAEQRIALAQKTQKVLEKVEADRVKRAENQQKVIENQIAAGAKDQLDGETEISAIRQREIERRLKLLQTQIAGETDASGELSDIGKNLYSERQVLETELTKVVAEEVNKRYEIQLKYVERARDELASAITLAETEATQSIQEAQNKGLLNQEQVETRRIALTKERLTKELALEYANIEQLQALPDPADPEKAEAHQKQIRAAKLKTAQLISQLAEQEFKAQEDLRKAAIKAIDQQVKEVENAANAAEQLSKIASGALERQNKLLDAQKTLRSSIAGLIDQEYKILIDTTKDEDVKAKLQEKAAKARLDALTQSQAIERQILDLQLKQEEVQSRVAIIKSAAALEKAKAEEQKVNIDPNATQADRQAAAIGVSAAQIELQGNIAAAEAQQQLAGIRRQQQAVDQRKDSISARFDYANTLADPDKKERAINRIRKDAARDVQARQPQLLPIGNRPQPDYSQVDSAARQLGILKEGDQRGRFLAPPPVDLHSGATQSMGAQSDFSQGLSSLKDLTQVGVVGNLLKIVESNKALSATLTRILERPRVQQTNNNNYSPRFSDPLAGTGY